MKLMNLTCGRCTREFQASVLHSGFNDSEYLYCNCCHRVASLNIYSGRSALLRDLAKPKLWSWRESSEDRGTIEAALERCECGGAFKFDATPSCPHCSESLLLEEVIKSLKAESWWGNEWRGVYCLIIEDGLVEDPFKEDSRASTPS